MTADILNSALGRVAEAAYQADIYDSVEQARKHLVTGVPKMRTNSTRDAVIEAIAIKGLDPKADTEPHFRETLGEFLRKDDPVDQELPRLLDKIVGKAVKEMTEERLLGKSSDIPGRFR